MEKTNITKAMERNKMINEEIQFLPINEMKFESVVSVLSETTDWGQIFTGIPEAHKYTRGEGIKVAILDTGAPNHIDVNDNVLTSVDCTGSGATDAQGHGTHVCGIVAALENGMGIIGVAPKAQLIPIKVLGNNGTGNYEYIISGIKKAIELKADIINMSLGAPFQPPPQMKWALKEAYDAGIIIVAAAGNDGGPVNFPAKYDEVIAVAAVDRNGKLANFSSHGPEIAISAPGVGIYSTFLNNQYAVLNGTSQASPLVAGICALILSWSRSNPDVTKHIHNTQEMLKALDELCDPVGRIGFSGKDGDIGLGIPGFINFMPWKTQEPQETVEKQDTGVAENAEETEQQF